MHQVQDRFTLLQRIYHRTLSQKDKKRPTLRAPDKHWAPIETEPQKPPAPAPPAVVPVAKVESTTSPKVTVKKSDVPTGKKPDAHSADPVYKPRVTLAGNMEPTYFIGGGNGNALIEEVLNELGWKRIKDKLDDNYRLKWCELKSAINYNSFKEGEQIVNHIPNCQLLTNKMGLLNSLLEYDRVYTTVKQKSSRLDFIPETLKLDDARDRESFLENFKENEVWICKPTGRNQGKGIFLVRDLGEVKRVIADNNTLNQELKEHVRPQRALNRIVQRYIGNPLLLNGRKFDIRAYMLVASTVPYLVLYHKGYVRLCMHEYKSDSSNLTAHLTNQFIQKKDPNYKDSKEETVWSMDRLNSYVNEELMESKGVEKDWVYHTLTNRMKNIMTYCFNAVKGKLHCKVGYFDLYGLDFMVDDDLKVWLIEVNVNPCLSTNCEALKEVVPSVVKETIHLAVECFGKSRKSRPLFPLQSLKGFQILFNGAPRQTAVFRHRSHTSMFSKGLSPISVSTTQDNRVKSQSPVRRTRSLSPVKEPVENTQPTTRPRPPAPQHRQLPTATATTTTSAQVSKSVEKPTAASGMKTQEKHVPVSQSANSKLIKDKLTISAYKPVGLRLPGTLRERAAAKSSQPSTKSNATVKPQITKTETGGSSVKDDDSTGETPDVNKSANNNTGTDSAQGKTSLSSSVQVTKRDNKATLKMTHSHPEKKVKTDVPTSNNRGS